MKRTPNWKENIDLDQKCGSCKHYTTFIKEGITTARGHCGIKNNLYVQRTDFCLKYERGK